MSGPAVRRSRRLRGLTLACALAATPSACAHACRLAPAQPPDVFERAERSPQEARLPLVHAALRARFDGIVAAAAPKGIVASVRGDTSLSFALGGLYDLGGNPEYRHGCGDPAATASTFYVSRSAAWVTDQGVEVLDVVGVTASVDTALGPAGVRLTVRHHTVPPRRLRSVTLSVNGDHVWIWVATNPHNEVRGFPVPAADSAAARAFAAAATRLRDAR